MSEYSFKTGLKDGIPIFLGYLSVSFGFGVYVVGKGLTVLNAVLISLTNVTSAGQVAGVDIIAAAGTILELVITELVINIRYALMSISLTQKLDSSFTTPYRLMCGFAITDEIFGVAQACKGLLGKTYFLGLMSTPLLGWTLGTLLGALAGSIMPETVSNAMGIMLYAMFIAIVLPPAVHSRPLALCVIIACTISSIIKFVPFFSFITPGFAVVICALVASVIVALKCPIQIEEEQHE